MPVIRPLAALAALLLCGYAGAAEEPPPAYQMIAIAHGVPSAVLYSRTPRAAWPYDAQRDAGLPEVTGGGGYPKGPLAASKGHNDKKLTIA